MGSKKTFTFPSRNTSKERISEVTLAKLMERNDENFANPSAILIDSTSYTEATVLQYIHKWIQYKKRNLALHQKHVHRGKMWVYFPVDKLRMDIGVCRETAYKTLRALVQKELLLVDSFNGKSFDRTKWYTLNYQTTLILREKHPKVTKTTSETHLLDEETQSSIVYPVDNALSSRQTMHCLPTRRTIPPIPSSILAPMDESSLRSDVSSLRSDTHPYRSQATTKHVVCEEVSTLVTEHSAAQDKRLPTHHSGLGDQLKKQQSEARMTKAKEKLNLAGKIHVAEIFWQTLMSHYEMTTFLSLTKAERGMMKNLVTQLIAAKIPPGDFLEFVVANWSSIRRKLTWPDNPKKFRLGEHPFFQEIAYNKNDLIRLWELRDSSGPTGTKEAVEYVYTRVEDIPKKHPRYSQLMTQIEINGKAVTRIKGTD